MEKNTKHGILKYVLLFCLLLFSFGLWRSVDRAIFVEGASVWLAPIVWSSSFFVVFSLATLLIKERSLLLLVVAFSFLTSFVFSFSLFHFLFLILAVLLVLIAEGRTREDFHDRMKINLGRNIRAGSTFIIFALGLAIATQYYFETKDLASEKLMPRFELGKETSGLALKLISNFVPQAKDLGNDETTIDQYILEMYEKQKTGSLLLEDPAVKELEKSLAVTEGRKKISEIALREVRGDEKISDVFSGIINSKISGYFTPDLGKSKDSSILPLIIAIALLLTVTSLGSFLILLWILLVKIIFFILKEFGVISVALAPAEKEIVE